MAEDYPLFFYGFFPRGWIKGRCKSLPNNYIQREGHEPMPIEDCDCLVSVNDMTVNEAFEKWSGMVHQLEAKKA